MTKQGLDFRNPVGLSTFECFKCVCIMERNTAEIGRPAEPKPVQNSPRNRTKPQLSTHQVNYYSSKDEQDLITVHSSSAAPTQAKHTQWSFTQSLKYPCPIANHKHKITSCAEYFVYSPAERWAKKDKVRICYCCLKPKSICQSRRCSNKATVPKVLKCLVCSEWAATKGMAPFSILYCKR